MGVSEKIHQMDGGGVVESEKWVFSGIAVIRSPLKPVFTKPAVEKKELQEDQDCSTTPTAAESRIPTRLSCPPAPKKRKPSSRSSSCHREFFNPPDLDTLFVRRTC
ncbi:hypothetical protein ABFS82_05G019300 [Erythranthe guttata]|uniref:Uncharacterized protein n=1 Tax=Erythranthe guttata TaxID=4155 RepID=A0A022Q7N6_ERYGU|nr:PREDICTED: uncharacterized protein LOC105974602 [Erythranthe guttata]EYU22525.1 hypothetical protein MIMGU_mgv1a026152mg [Erythranthe guttata]|eukprot:XP_012855171.1 PREDICTED: uncharacterized protein LOC105974602 [Erythranthe guttata]